MAHSSWVSVADARHGCALPLICDSPHSGVTYPEDFGHDLPLSQLRLGEDTHVERLWSHATDVGATLIAANFPRTYIDPNRTLRDIDPGMLDGPWPWPIEASRKTELGIGLVWRQVRDGAPIYRRKLSVSEVLRRVEACWKPYHLALQSAAEKAVATWGGYWHLNLHSMPHDAYRRLGIVTDKPLADFVLGDLHGRSCEPGFVHMVGKALQQQGFTVAVNDPYEGQELVRMMGRPAARKHSLQVEINRALYMNEATREPHPHFDSVREALAGVLDEVASYVRLHAGRP